VTLPRYAVRVDKSAPAIVEALEKCGFHVHRISVPTDAIVSRRGHWHMVEFKTGKAGKLTPAQERFKAAARAPVQVLRDAGAAIEWAKTVP